MCRMAETWIEWIKMAGDCAEETARPCAEEQFADVGSTL